MGISNLIMSIFSAPCVRFIRDRTYSDHSCSGLSYRTCDGVVLSVRVSVQRHTNQQLVRATIGALVLGCPPLGNSRTRSYHAIGRYSLHMGPACGCDRHMCACMQVFLTFAPVNDHVMPGDVTFTVVCVCGMWR